jgi:hypothetical protein
MSTLPMALTCVAVLLASCRYSSTTGGSAAGVDPSPVGYPQLFWMFTLYEVPPEVEFAPDGTLRRAVGRANGYAEVSSADLNAVYDSIQAYPGARFIAAPAILTQPGELARIAPHDVDKAGASIGPREIEVRGSPADGGLTYELDLTTAPGAGCGSDPRQLATGRAVLLLCPGGDASTPLTLLVLRPSILRSPADHPYQRAAVGLAP